MPDSSPSPHNQAQTAPLLQGKRLRDCVMQAVQQYLDQLGDNAPENLYHVVLEELEVPLIESMLRHTQGNQSQAAKALGINRATLRKKMNQYGIQH